jgi:hypothetical protein
MPQKTALPPSNLTRKQQHHLRRDEVQTRIVLAAFLGVLVLIAAIIGYGYVRAYVLRQGEPVAVVYGETITIAQWQKEVRYERLQNIDLYQQYAAYYQVEADATIRGYYKSFADQYVALLSDNMQIGKNAQDFLVQGAIIRHQAALLNIAVSDEEVQGKIDGIFGYTPSATLTAQPSVTPSATNTPTATPAADAPTATAAPTVAATPTLSATQQAMLLPTMVPPTATPYSEESFQKSFSAYMDMLNKKTGMTEADFRERVRVVQLLAKVRASVISTVPRDQEQYHLLRISAPDEVTAAADRVRITGGEDFSTVAKEVSTDANAKTDGGDIGWIGSGILPTAVEDKVFALNVGDVSEVVQIDSATWAIFKLVAKEVRPLDDIPYNAAQTAFYNKWLADLETKENVLNILGFTDVLPTDPVLSQQ